MLLPFTSNFTPCKGIQDSLGFCIPRRGFRIPATGFQFLSVELGSWIPIVSGICYPESGIRSNLGTGRDRDGKCAGCGIVLKKERECEISFSLLLPPPGSSASKLSGALWRRGGKEGELANLNSASNSPVAPRRLSCHISANQREVRTSANVNKLWKKSTKGNDVITNVISAN